MYNTKTNDFEGEVRVNDGESIKFEWINPHNIPDNTAKTHRTIISDYLRIV